MSKVKTLKLSHSPSRWFEGNAASSTDIPLVAEAASFVVDCFVSSKSRGHLWHMRQEGKADDCHSIGPFSESYMTGNL